MSSPTRALPFAVGRRRRRARRPLAGPWARAAAALLALLTAQVAPASASAAAAPHAPHHGPRRKKAEPPRPALPKLVVVTGHTTFAPDLRPQLVRLVERPLHRRATILPFAHYLRAARHAKVPAGEMCSDTQAVRVGRELGARYALTLVSDRNIDPEQVGSAGARPSLLAARLLDTASGSVLWESRYPVTKRLSPVIARRLVVEVTRTLDAQKVPGIVALPLVAAPPPGPAPASPWDPFGAPRLDAPAPVVPGGAAPTPASVPPPAAATPALPPPPTPSAYAQSDDDAAEAPPPPAEAVAADGTPKPRKHLPARPSLRVSAAGGGWVRRGKISGDVVGDAVDPRAPAYGPPAGKSLPIFVRGEAAVEIYPLAAFGVDTVFADLGLQARADLAPVSTLIADTQEVDRAAIFGYDAGAVWRWTFADEDGAGLDLQLNGGWGRWRFPIVGSQFPTMDYAFGYAGGAIGGSLMRELSLVVGGRFKGLVDARGTEGVLGRSTRYGWGVEATASLRWVVVRHLELSLNGYWETFRTPWTGTTRFVGSALQFTDVDVTDSQAGATVGVGYVLW